MNKSEAVKKALKISMENADEIIIVVVISKNDYTIYFDDKYAGDEELILERYLNGKLV